MRKSTGIILFSILILFFSGGWAEADIYQYKDKNGNWVLTDSPPDHAEIIDITRGKERTSPGAVGFRDIEKGLKEKFNPKSEIETASISTVTIRTSLGLGSGFFINENGYILTNKHVLRGDETQIKKTEEFIARQDSRIADDEAAIANAENQLRRTKNDLDEYKAYIDGMTNPNVQATAMQKYRSQITEYEFYDTQLRKQKNELEEKISKYRQETEQFSRKAVISRHERRFTVILKDKTELEANLVSISNDHDLALLRITNCKSPFIQPGATSQIIQGMRVFAIGSPLGVGDSVSSGVVSGYDNNYIRTDAKIYLGNSGGPLITADGKVIGINTMKLITRKFEGMGFAIPIGRAFQEFSNYVLSNP
jgi:V8-like Glu-specific endopeptidase